MNAPAFNYSRVVDLSRPLDTGPDQHPWFRYETDIESIVSDPESAPPEGRWYVVTTLRLSGHAGTHVEAPLHAVENGASVGEVPVERFFGEAVVLDLTEVPWGRPLEPEVVQEAAAKAGGVRRGDILFMHFDWDRRKAAEQGTRSPRPKPWSGWWPRTSGWWASIHPASRWPGAGTCPTTTPCSTGGSR
ncbi:MAG: cyclase family protein [Gemmatimonadetes bacterium]|nr:cyclase family protein [Gemmatimonadota bacterium]